jgi:hypothetical protein
MKRIFFLHTFSISKSINNNIFFYYQRLTKYFCFSVLCRTMCLDWPVSSFVFALNQWQCILSYHLLLPMEIIHKIEATFLCVQPLILRWMVRLSVTEIKYGIRFGSGRVPRRVMEAFNEWEACS